MDRPVGVCCGEVRCGFANSRCPRYRQGDQSESDYHRSSRRFFHSYSPLAMIVTAPSRNVSSKNSTPGYSPLVRDDRSCNFECTARSKNDDASQSGNRLYELIRLLQAEAKAGTGCHKKSCGAELSIPQKLGSSRKKLRIVHLIQDSTKSILAEVVPRVNLGGRRYVTWQQAGRPQNSYQRGTQSGLQSSASRLAPLFGSLAEFTFIGTTLGSLTSWRHGFPSCCLYWLRLFQSTR